MGSGSSVNRPPSSRRSNTYIDHTAPEQQSKTNSGRRSSGSTKMPWFRKQSENAKKKLQHQLYLARESPELTFDISECEITDVPGGVFSLCKVLQKEFLLLHNNWLTSLKGGGNFRDLDHLKMLDLHDNDLSSLPDELGYLSHLQVLNVAGNKLKHLPHSLEHLKSLTNLNCKGNKLKEIPESLCNLKSLRQLDVSGNLIHRLPDHLCHVRTLEEITLDTQHMAYPNKEVCSEGTEAIMRFLCEESGIQYLPPSEFSGATPSPPASPFTTTSNSNSHIDEMLHTQRAVNSVMKYEQMKEKKRQEMISLEKQLEEEQRLQAQMAAKASEKKKQMIQLMTQDQDRLQDELTVLQQHRDADRQRLVHTLYEAEANSTHLVKELLEMNERSHKTETLLEQMEKERMELEQWFEVRQEEVELLRKKDVLVNMEKLLQQNAVFTHMIENYMTERDQVVQRTHNDAVDRDERFHSVLASKQLEQTALLDQLFKEEKLQKGAFAALQLQRDAKHKRISSQVDLIEQELAQLTLLEVEQRQLKMDVKINVLAEKRHDLSQLLLQLLEEKTRREGELGSRLVEMETRREDNQTDYWLVQYQRLMDMKPQAMINMEKRLEIAVVEVLEGAGAGDYLPTFSRHRITIETLCQLTDDDLKQMGVHEMGLRKALLTEISKCQIRREEERAAAKLKHIDQDEWLVKPPSPDTPCPPRPAPQAPAAASQAVTEVTARVNTECVVCLERDSVMLFLNCGHICCCRSCAEPLKECPLCRGDIIQRIRLSTGPGA